MRVNFDLLNEEQKEFTDEQVAGEIKQLEEKVNEMNKDLRNYNPNLKAKEKFNQLEEKMRVLDEEIETKMSEGQNTEEDYIKIKQMRTQKFMDAFNKIKDSIDGLYKKLTKSDKNPAGGTATLNLENQFEPFSGGVIFNCMPPNKRFREMESLSGGEKTIAALAIIFAMQMASRTPFFVLDEVDAALDNNNISLVLNFIMKECLTTQFIIISLKNQF